MELLKKESTLQIFQCWSQGLTSDTWNLKYPALSTIQFYMPSVDEQKIIAEYFAKLNNLITLHQQSISDLVIIHFHGCFLPRVIVLPLKDFS